jgi:hypothetical protein
MDLAGARIRGRRARSLLVLCVVAACAAPATVASAARHTSASCSVARTHVVASSRRAVIRAQRHHSPGAWYYGCAFASGRSHKLFRETSGSMVTSEFVTRAAVDNVFGALAVRHLDIAGGCWSQIKVFNLRTGDPLRQALALDRNDPASASARPCPSVARLVVTGTGGAAWATTSTKSWPTVEIRKDDKHGQATLDRGATINPKSLRLHGHTLSWVDGGVRHHVRIG